MENRNSLVYKERFFRFKYKYVQQVFDNFYTVKIGQDFVRQALRFTYNNDLSKYGTIKQKYYLLELADITKM